MAGKSPEKPQYEETPATGDSQAPVAPSVEGPTSIPPTPVISPLLARRLGARVLDPDTAVLAPGQPMPLPTVYVADTLLVRDIADPFLDADGGPTRVDELIAYAGLERISLVLKQVGEPVSVPHRGKSDSLSPDAKVTVTRVRLERDPAKAGKVPDAWRFLQDALTEPSERGSLLYDKLGLGRLPDPTDSAPDSEDKKRLRERRDRRGRSMASGVSVEHVLTAGGGMWGGGGGMWGGGGGMWGGGGGMWGGGGLLAEYGTPGIGGRNPVVWSACNPRDAMSPTAKSPTANPPVVAVLDTGLGKHPWFPDEDKEGTPEDEKATAEECTGACPGAHRRVTFAGQRIGVWQEPSRDPENTGVIIDDVNGLVDVLCGHGTFISGVIRQRCPEAVILEVPIMASDGAALEDDIVKALGQLLDRHRAAKAAPGTITHGELDVVNLSLGYYHETPDEADDTALYGLLQDFADAGVVVVACAGNDSTRARFFPAAFAAPGHDGLVGVGATNPDDHSIALFSNVGDWVTAHAPGAGVVSTVPITLSGSLNPALSVNGFGPGPRAGVDFDDFRSGFAVWSGTSFAAPWIVGEIAAEITRQGSPKNAVGSPSRARTASGKVVPKAKTDRFGKKE